MEWVTIDESVGSEQEFYWLWIAATTAYGVGDIVTTIALVSFAPAVQEANPLVNLGLDTLGLPGLVVLKLVVFFILLAISVTAMHVWNDRFLYAFPPLLLAILGTVLTARNIRLLMA